MGWQERGKRGVRCGRTVRRNSTVYPRQRNGVILKYQQNAGEFSFSVKTNILEDRYDLTDGLHMTHIPHRQNTHVEFSLGKRKRWLLRDLVKERQIIDEEVLLNEDNNGDDEEFEDIHVSFHERHILPGPRKCLGDCVSYYSDHVGEKSPRGHYSFYTDLNQQSTTVKPPEIGYEMCNPPTKGTWPDFCEGQYRYERYWDINGKKAKCKCKGMYKKDRFGLKNDKEIYAAPRKYQKEGNAYADCKVKVVSQKEFDLVNKHTNTAKRNTGLIYIDDALAHSAKKHTNLTTDKSLTNISDFKKYGKGCAVFVENAPLRAESSVAPHQESEQSFVNTQHKVNVHIDVAELEASKLVSQWGECYQEGTVQPRMFTINVTSFLPTKLKADRETYVIFELQDESLTGASDVVTTAALIHATVGKNSKLENIATDFVKYIERISHHGTSLLGIKDIVEAGIQCVKVAYEIEDRLYQLKVRETMSGNYVANLNLLNSTYGWKSEALSLVDAQKQIKEKLETEGKQRKSSKAAQASASGGWTTVSVECEICSANIEDNTTCITLNECGHSFCNDCWASHLVTQVSQGMECIKCPGYKCDSEVDNMIMMNLTPKLYERYLNTVVSKHLEASPNWKWCPGKHCQKLVKANNNNKGMTVMCSCNTTWCYKCQEKAHWPATCKESKLFFKRSGYAEYLLQKESQDLISSVMVKNCPQCNYPIEKYQGCQFMHCVLCNCHFCWNCQTEANYGHSCEKKPDDDLTLVLFNIRSKRFQVQKYLQVMVNNNEARLSSLMYAKQRRLDKLEVAVQTSELAFTHESNSRMTQFMESLADNHVLHNVRRAVQFEYQARIILDGLIQKAAVSKSLEGRVASMKMSKLVYITGRIDSILSEPGLMDKHDRLAWLNRLVDIGMEVLVSLKNLA